MDSDYEKLLEAEIGRELKGLPDLKAPPTLAPRVMRAIAARAGVRSSRPSWCSWPLVLRAGSLAALLVLFVGLCAASSALAQSGPVLDLSEHYSHWYSALSVVWRGFDTVLGLFATAFRLLDTRWLLAGTAAVLLSYAACLALAAGSLRLALARTRHHPL